VGSAAEVAEIPEQEGELGDSRPLAKTIVESALDCIIVMDHSGRIVEFNPAAEQAFGYPRAQALAKKVSDLMPPEMASAHRKAVRRLLRTGTAHVLDQRLETTARRADGTLFPIELTVTRVPQQEPPLFVGFLRDLSESKRTQEDLRESTQRLQQSDAERLRLLRKLVAAHENERRSIAAAIHDDSIQAVAALAIRVSAMRRKAQDDGVRASLAEIEESVSEAVTRLRRLMFELHPTTLDRGGLAATIENLIEQFVDDDTSYSLDDGLSREPSQSARLALYRVVQEAITNARKHAKARNIVVQLGEDGDTFVARVNDDGVGFSIAEIESPAGHLGLSTMREQAEMASGDITIESSGKGTTVEARIPAAKPDMQ
jgi:PAS domain S-box-containing protein